MLAPVGDILDQLREYHVYFCACCREVGDLDAYRLDTAAISQQL